MSCIDDEILKGAESDAKEVQFIKSYMGSEWEENFSEEDLYYCLDVIFEYFESTSNNADADGFVDVDTEEIARFISKKAKKEGMGPYNLDALTLLVDAELEYNESLEDE